MLTMVGAIVTFECDLMLERQTERIAIAKSKDKYKVRVPTAMAKNIHKTEIAKRLGISRSSVQRISLGKL